MKRFETKQNETIPQDTFATDLAQAAGRVPRHGMAGTIESAPDMRADRKGRDDSDQELGDES